MSEAELRLLELKLAAINKAFDEMVLFPILETAPQRKTIISDIIQALNTFPTALTQHNEEQRQFEIAATCKVMIAKNELELVATGYGYDDCNGTIEWANELLEGALSQIITLIDLGKQRNLTGE
mgnify:CR=1 FL=1